MAYISYNDYELIYLIRDGCEPALNAFYKKYLSLIWKIARNYYVNSDKVNDLVSVGLQTLFTVLEKYNSDLGVSFYSFFVLCVNRQFIKELKSDYYRPIKFLEENEVSYNSHALENKRIVNYAKLVCKDELDYKVYDDCIIDTMSVKTFSKINGVTITKARYRKDHLIKELKKILTNEGF